MTKPKSPGSLLDAETRNNLIRTCPVKRQKKQGPMDKHEQVSDILERATKLAGEMSDWIGDMDIANTGVVTVAFGMVLTRIFTSRVNQGNAKEIFREWIKTLEHMTYAKLQKAKDERTGE